MSKADKFTMKIESARPKVYLDIEIGGEKVGRVVAELFDDLAPKAAANFLSLVKSDQKGTDDKVLSFKGNHFHKVIKNFMIQAGDITNGSDSYDKDSEELGTGGESIYGAPFKDENTAKFDTVFNLAMANTGAHSNKSQFFINTYPSPHLSGKHTIFGRIIKGKSTIRTIEYSPVNDKSIPIKDIVIKECGEWDESKGVPVYNTSYSTICGDIYEEYPDDDDHFDKEKPSESFEAASKIKDAGGALFKQKNTKEALFKYRKALRYVNELIPDKDSELELALKFEELKKKLFLNLALTSINLKDYKRAIDYSTYLLESENLQKTDKAKGYYRRGTAKVELGKYEEALKDLTECLALNSTDKVVEKKFKDTEELIKKQKDKEKQKYAKFFGGK